MRSTVAHVPFRVGASTLGVSDAPCGSKMWPTRCFVEVVLVARGFKGNPKGKAACVVFFVGGSLLRHTHV